MVMKNNFSFRRIGLMLKADWIEYKMAFLIFAASLLAINLFMFQNMREGFQAFLFVAGIISCILFSYMLVGWKVHRSKNRFLTLPCSTIEKFIEILLVGFILICFYLLIYTIIAGSSHLISGEPMWLLTGANLNVQPAESKILAIGLILFICIFLFMCSIAFRKFPLGIGILMLISYASIISYTIYFIVRYEKLLNISNSQSGFIQSNALFETMQLLNTYNVWVMCIASVVLLYVSYLKLKEKQIR
jgi:hypothetical protein